MLGTRPYAGLVWLLLAAAHGARQIDDCIKVVSGAAPAPSGKAREQKILESCKFNRPRSGILEHDAEKDCAQLVGLWKTAVHYQPGVSVQGFCNTLKDFAPPRRPLPGPMSSEKTTPTSALGVRSKVATTSTTPLPQPIESSQNDAMQFSDLVAQAAQNDTQPSDQVQNNSLNTMIEQVGTDPSHPKTGKPTELDELLFVDSCVQYATTVESRIGKHKSLAEKILRSCKEHLPSEESFCHGYISLIQRHAKHPELVRFCASEYQHMQAAGTLPTSTDSIWGPSQADEGKEDPEVPQGDEASQLPDGVLPDPLTSLSAPAESVEGVTDNALLGESSQVVAADADAEAAMVDAADTTLAGATDITDPAEVSADATDNFNSTDLSSQSPADDGFSSLMSMDGPTPEALTALESPAINSDIATDTVSTEEAALQPDPALLATSTDSAMGFSGPATSSADRQVLDDAGAEQVLDDAASVVNGGSPAKAPPAKVAPAKVHRQTYLTKKSQTQSVRVKHAIVNKIRAKQIKKSSLGVNPHHSSFTAVGHKEEHSVHHAQRKVTFKESELKSSRKMHIPAPASKATDKHAAIAKSMIKHTKALRRKAPVARTHAELISMTEGKHAPKKEHGHASVKPVTATVQKNVAHVEAHVETEHRRAVSMRKSTAHVEVHAETDHRSAVGTKPVQKTNHKHVTAVEAHRATKHQHGIGVEPALNMQRTHVVKDAGAPKMGHTHLSSELAQSKNLKRTTSVKPVTRPHLAHVTNPKAISKVQWVAKPEPREVGKVISDIVKDRDTHKYHPASRLAGEKRASPSHTSLKQRAQRKEGQDSTHSSAHASFITDSDLGNSFKQVLKDHVKRTAKLQEKHEAELLAKSKTVAANHSHPRRLHKAEHKAAAANRKPLETGFGKSHRDSRQPSTKARDLSLSQSHGLEKFSTADLFGKDSELFADDKKLAKTREDFDKFAAQILTPKPEERLTEHKVTHVASAPPRTSLVAAKVPQAVEPKAIHAAAAAPHTSTASAKVPRAVAKTQHASAHAAAHHGQAHIAKARAVQDPSSSSQVNSFFEEFVSNWRGEVPHHSAKPLQHHVDSKQTKHLRRPARLSLVQAKAPRSWRVHKLPMTAADEFFDGFLARYGQQIDTGVAEGGVSRGQRGMSLIGSESSISHVKGKPSRNKKAIDAFLDGFKDRYMAEPRDLNGKEPPRPALISAEAQGKSLISTGSSGDIFGDDDPSFIPPARPGGSEAAWQAFTRAAIV